MGARRRRGGGGVPEMGFRARLFVLCKDRCCHQRRRNTNFGPEKFFHEKIFSHMCSQNDQRNVGIILSHVCWGRTPPPPPPSTAGRAAPAQTPLPVRRPRRGSGGLGKWASVPSPPPPQSNFFPAQHQQRSSNFFCSSSNTKCHLIMKGCKNKYVKEQVKQTLKRRQDFGESLMALEILFPMVESKLGMGEDIKTFMACSICMTSYGKGSSGQLCFGRVAGVADLRGRLERVCGSSRGI